MVTRNTMAETLRRVSGRSDGYTHNRWTEGSIDYFTKEKGSTTRENFINSPLEVDESFVQGFPKT